MIKFLRLLYKLPNSAKKHFPLLVRQWIFAAIHNKHIVGHINGRPLVSSESDLFVVEEQYERAAVLEMRLKWFRGGHPEWLPEHVTMYKAQVLRAESHYLRDCDCEK